MDILVTGGAGAIGAFVAHDLATLGHEVTVLTRRPDLAARVAGAGPGSVTYARGGLDRVSVRRALTASRATRIVHMAAMLDDCQLDLAGGVEVNLIGTVNLLEEARAHGVQRVVFTSSKRAMGPITGRHGHPTYEPVDETYVPQPRLMYDVTKFASEVIGANYEAEHGLEFVVVRFAQTYCPGKAQRPDAAMLAVRSTIIEGAMRGLPVRIAKGGDAKDDCIYVRDVAQGITQALLQPDLTSRLFHLGSGTLVSLRDFADAVRTHLPGADIEIGPGTAFRDDVGYPFECLFDITRARRELGFEPRFDLVAGVGDYIESTRTWSVESRGAVQ